MLVAAATVGGCDYGNAASSTAPQVSAEPSRLEACQLPSDESYGVPAESPAGMTVLCAVIPAPPGDTVNSLNVAVATDDLSDPFNGKTAVLWSPGGPGLSPVEALRGGGPGLDLSTYAIVTWDGVTASAHGGFCGETSQDAAIHGKLDADAVAVECQRLAPMPEDPTGMASEELEAVRQFLQLDKIDLLMHSYATAIGQRYLESHRDRVLRAVFDGPLALGIDWETRTKATSAAIDDAWQVLTERCRTTCSDPVRSLLAKPYDEIRSAVIRVAPPVGGGTATLTPALFDAAALMAIRSDKYWQSWVDALKNATSGDATDLYKIGVRYFTSLDMGVYFGTLCPAFNVRELSQASKSGLSELGRAFVDDFAPCQHYEAGQSTNNSGLADDGSLLLLASDLDPVTPTALLAGLPLGKTLVCDTGLVGHTSFGEQNARGLALSFLAGTGHGNDATLNCAS